MKASNPNHYSRLSSRTGIRHRRTKVTRVRKRWFSIIFYSAEYVFSYSFMSVNVTHVDKHSDGLLVYPARWRVIEFYDSRRCMHWCRQDLSFISRSSPMVAIWRDMVYAWYCHTDVWSMFYITRVAKTRAFLADSRKSWSLSHELHIGTILHLSYIRRSLRSFSLHSRRNLPDDEGRLLECSTYQTPAWSSAQQGEYYSPSYVLYSEHKPHLHQRSLSELKFKLSPRVIFTDSSMQLIGAINAPAHEMQLFQCRRLRTTRISNFKTTITHIFIFIPKHWYKSSQTSLDVSHNLYMNRT